MTVQEAFEPVTHKHNDCPICNSQELIHDIVPVRNYWDHLIATIANSNARMRVALGKRIEVKEG